eukprot:CAMPEP_0171067010 /NCGR_PEP_ID=MMETSP0766_2-20121228/7746_1 /TAXON_ID=439317 /ORGANISM="Gambierdiscus australes, Strain CAWD 149" /LENGTH=195 /DNA_ID=CAMNT_0011523217 /DNA_START=46 /DNA_END=633 /DNA_ORIENTATION=-
MADDPEVLVRQVLASGARVQISGLQGRADLNGRAVKVLGVDKASGRWECELLSGVDQGAHVRCKPENLLITEGGADHVDPPEKTAELDADKRLEELVGKRSRSRSRRRSRSKSKSKSRSKSKSSSSHSSSSSSSSSSSRDRKRRRRSPSRRRRSSNFQSIQLKQKDDPKTKKEDKKRKKNRSAGAEAAAFLLGLK